MQYDLTILAVPLVLLAYDYSQFGFRKNELLFTTLIWFLPVVSWPLMRFTAIQICPLVLVFQLIVIILRVKREKEETLFVQPNQLSVDKESRPQ
jgi:hypothetical protein